MNPPSVLEAVVNASSDAIITADANGSIMTWNRAAARLFGHSAQQAFGAPLKTLISEGKRTAFEALLAEVSDSPKSERVQSFTGLHRDGREFPIELKIFCWGQGSGRQFGCIIPDEDEKHRIAEDLAQSQLRMQSIMDTANDAIICANQLNEVIFWNAAAERMLGHSAQDLIGKNMSRIVPERFRALHEAGIQRVASGGERRVIGRTVQLAALHSDGHEIPIELSLSTWQSGDMHFFGGIIRDITERVHLMDELGHSEERMRSIMESANDAIICANSKGEIILWNPAAEQVLGHRHEDVIGKSLTVIIPKRYRSAHRSGMARVASGGERHVIGKTAELQAIHADGHEIPIELSLGTWDVEGERFFSGIIRDVSARKAAEEEIKHVNETLDAKNQQLESLSVKLAKYLSRQVYNSIFEGKTDVRVESYRKHLTVFFSDIKGFTEMTDKMEAETLSELLNKYLSEMAKIAEGCGGTIDKFIGDGIMIFFGDPETNGDREDAVACVDMALRMRRRIRELCREWQDRGVSDPLQVRIGVNSGYCTVGNFGSEDRMDYTIVGGQVNITSRLETAAAPDQILISHATYALVKHRIECRLVGEIMVKGVAHPIRTYEAIRMKDDHSTSSAMQSAQKMLENLDFGDLDEEERKATKQSLLRALKELDG